MEFLLIKILNIETTQRGHLIFVSEQKMKANKVLLCSETTVFLVKFLLSIIPNMGTTKRDHRNCLKIENEGKS